jgi:hypothetical protein
MTGFLLLDYLISGMFLDSYRVVIISIHHGLIPVLALDALHVVQAATGQAPPVIIVVVTATEPYFVYIPLDISN